MACLWFPANPMNHESRWMGWYLVLVS